jgi:CRP-like cAMP-binding protein
MTSRRRQHHRPTNDLAQLRPFVGCTPLQLRRISQWSTTLDVGCGRVLCRQGDVAREGFIVVDGTARVTIDDSPVAVIERHGLIGEIALFAERGARSATVSAMSDMTLVVFNRAEFSAAMFEVPPFAQFAVRQAASRLVENAARASTRRSLISSPAPTSTMSVSGGE